MNKNYWPMGIFLLAMAVVGLIALTLKTAISNPVELQGMCQWKPQEVDERANEITQKRQQFLEKYAIGFIGDKTPDSSEFQHLFLSLIAKQTHSIPEAKVLFFLTRPHTTREDIDLGEGEISDLFFYQSKTFDALKKGRWQAEAYVEIGEDFICFTEEFEIQ